MKQCGNCEFWDSENVESADGVKFAWCSWLDENQSKCSISLSSTVMEPNDGIDCPVYKEAKQ